MWNRAGTRRVELVGRLPALGNAHPLRRTAVRTLYRATALTILLFLVVPLAVIIFTHAQPETIPYFSPDQARKEWHLMPPPPLTNDRPAAPNLTPELTAPTIGVPDPVPDFQADFITIADVSEIMRVFLPIAEGAFDPRRDSIVVEEYDRDRIPSPQEIVPVEVQPMLIDLPAPVYPEIARMAGVEGTVVVRSLVGPKGKVLDAFVVDGHDMLKAPALESARGATYRPALQQDHPVAVWVIQRITFRLH